MLRKLTRLSLAAVLGAGVVTLSVGPDLAAADKGDKAPSIKDIMSAGHKGDDALMAKTILASKGGKWDDAQKYAKKLAENGASLAKNTPKRGEADSWSKLAKKYAENTQVLADATDKKDGPATKAALETIGASCKECHMAHKGKGK